MKVIQYTKNGVYCYCLMNLFELDLFAHITKDNLEKSCVPRDSEITHIS